VHENGIDGHPRTGGRPLWPLHPSAVHGRRTQQDACSRIEGGKFRQPDVLKRPPSTRLPPPITAIRCSKAGADTNLTDHREGRLCHRVDQPQGRMAKNTGLRPREQHAPHWPELAAEYGHDELRNKPRAKRDLAPCAPRQRSALLCTRSLKQVGNCTANIGLISDIIACPGMLLRRGHSASIPIAQEIATRLTKRHELKRQWPRLKIKEPCCDAKPQPRMVGHMGILVLDRGGV